MSPAIKCFVQRRILGLYSRGTTATASHTATMLHTPILIFFGCFIHNLPECRTKSIRVESQINRAIRTSCKRRVPPFFTGQDAWPRLVSRAVAASPHKNIPPPGDPTRTVLRHGRQEREIQRDHARRHRRHRENAARPPPIISGTEGSGTSSTVRESIANPIRLLLGLVSKTDMYMLRIRPSGS